MLSEIVGDSKKTIQRIAPVEDSKNGDLVFVDKPEFVEIALKNKPSCVVTSAKFREQFESEKNITLLISPNVGLAHALIRQKYAARNYAESGFTNIHANCFIHESAKLHPSVVVEPKAVVGKNVVIGANSRVMSGVVVEHDVTIGSNTILQPNCVIGYGCKIGNDVLVGSGTVIGSEGYGFAQDQKRKSHPIPQTGIVVIEDRVRLGANNCIDRAAFNETRIGAGTKLDNLCHVAHNVQIGQDCLLTAMLCVAGSTEIGDRVITSGQTGFLDHMKVGNDIVLLHRAGVTKDIDKPGAYAGLPLQPLSEYMRNTAVMREAAELKKRILALEKQLLPKD